MRGIVGLASPEPGTLAILEEGNPLAGLASDWRQSFVAHTERTLQPKAAEIVDALCFNVDGRLPNEFRSNLQRTGTTHIVSASGIHVLILGLALQFLLAFLPVPRWAQIVLALLFLACYGLSTGLRPPIVRAVAMYAVMASAFLFRREGDLLSALALAALAYIVIEPHSAFDIGFQLSFLTVGALSLTLPTWRDDTSSALELAKDRLAGVMKTSGVATLASGPAVAYHFGVFSIISVIANVLIAAVLAPIIVVSLASLALKPVAEPLSVGLMHAVVSPLAGWVAWVVDTLGPLPFSALSVPEFSPYWLLLYFAVPVILWRRRARPV
jgi:competence protein ComEC